MPRLMHWLNWYSAMLLNRLLRRRGHFWERRYHAAAVPDRDYGHALRVLRTIHANPRTAGMIKDYHYAYSNCLPLVPGITGGAGQCGGRRRWRSCGPVCSRRLSGLSASISHLPQCRAMAADGEIRLYMTSTA
jgi:hypothetical protein